MQCQSTVSDDLCWKSERKEDTELTPCCLWNADWAGFAKATVPSWLYILRTPRSWRSWYFCICKLNVEVFYYYYFGVDILVFDKIRFRFWPRNYYSKAITELSDFILNLVTSCLVVVRVNCNIYLQMDF